MDHFYLNWPELDKRVRVGPLRHNAQVFEWFTTNLPTKSLQTHTVVAGYCLTSMSVPVTHPFPWRLETLVQEDLTELAVGRALLNMTVGRVVNLGFKWEAMTETMSYASWSEVLEEDIPVLQEVGRAVWANMLSREKRLIHLEFLPA